MKTLTVMPFLLAMFAAVAAMPTNVYQVCAWNAGTLEIEPWRNRASAALRSAAASIRAWVASLWGPRIAYASAAVLLAVMLAQLGANHEGLLLATLAPAVAQSYEAERARLLREVDALRGANGTFADDAARAAFDEKMARIESIDIALRGQSETLAERDPLDPGAPLAARTAATPPAEPDETAAAVARETARCQGIMSGCRAARLPQSFGERLIGDKVTLEAAQTRILDELARRGGDNLGPRVAGAAPSVSGGDDPLVHQRAGIENAILHRLNPDSFKLSEEGRKYRGLTMLDIARTFLQARGIRTTDMSKMDIAGTALGLRGGYHSTSDFANLLADVANKNLRAAYEEAPQTFKPFSRQTSAPDFKLIKRMQLGEAPQLKKVLDNGEFTRGTIGEGKEQYQLATYGRMFAITRQALVNDDTDAFSRVPMAFGRSARDLESDLVWEQITTNGAMGDGIAIFHASHNNLAGAGAVISVATIGAGRAAMRKQKGLDGKQRLNLAPKFLVVPPDIETVADQFVSTNLQASASSSVNPFAGKLQVVAEPRLSDNSITAWYLAAEPGSVDIIEYAYLEGESGPVVESRVGFDVDGVEVKCRHDFAAKVIDYRGLYKNPGA